jgi:hypothetical protein
MTKAKSSKSRVALPALKKGTSPPVSGGRRKPSEAETLPPPELSDAPSTGTSGRSGRVKKGPGAATVDEVTADLSKDPRHED